VLGEDRSGGASRVVAVDGRSSSGKSTLAALLRSFEVNSCVVHTDDIAWWHSRFGWVDLLVKGSSSRSEPALLSRTDLRCGMSETGPE
jgi:hypothetical protein